MQTETIELNTSRGTTTAFVARPTDQANAAVLLIQEWWGINGHIRDIAGRYANEGYVCVAPDLYRGKLARDADEAARLMHALAIEDGMETIRQALTETKRAYHVGKIGITGYCMGGTFALRAACELLELSASVAFYGDIPEEVVLQRLAFSTLFIAGKRDQWINTEKVNTLKAVAEQYNLPVDVLVYDADHAFFNDTRPEVYDPEAAADAWQHSLDFFRKHLGG